jgi:hypothetical protein
MACEKSGRTSAKFPIIPGRLSAPGQLTVRRVPQSGPGQHRRQFTAKLAEIQSAPFTVGFHANLFGGLTLHAI